MVAFDAEALKHRDEEVAERHVVVTFEGKMLAVLEAATGKQDGQVCVVVRVGVSHVAAEENHRAVEQSCVAVSLVGEVLQQLLQQSHLSAVGLFELSHLVCSLSVMAQVVIAGR